MRILLFIFCIMLGSCAQIPGESTSSPTFTFEMRTNSFNDGNYRSLDVDMNKRSEFWSNVALPIINSDKEKVMSNIDFPLMVDWDHILTSEKGANSSTRKNFENVYDKIFDVRLIEAIQSQTAEDIQVGELRDTIWYTISVGRKKTNSAWDVGLSLDYFEKDGAYKLKYVQAIAGDFYGEE